MLTIDALRRSVDSLVVGFLDLGLAEDTNRTVVRPDGEAQLVTWVSASEGVPLYSEPTVEEYQRLVSERQYNVLLSDFAMIQMSYWLVRGRIARHRLCFYPCPISGDSDEVREFGIVDYLDALTGSDYMRSVRLEGPVRFDYDESGARLGHAASHVTLGRECCRIPVFGPLSVGHFARVICEHFYPEWWQQHDAFRGLPLMWSRRSLLEQERFGLHLEWRQVLMGRGASSATRRV